MAKLIYSSAKWASASNKDTGALKDYANAEGSIYKSLIFTDDGYLVTHGKVFKMVDTESLDPSVTVAINSSTITITDTANGKTSTANLPVWNLVKGDYITLTNSKGAWTIAHTAPDSENTDNTTTLGLTLSNYVITEYTDSLVYDKYGHIQKSNSTTGKIHLDYVNLVLSTSAEANKKYYLLGGTSATASTSYTVKNPNVYVDTTADGMKLVTPFLEVTGSAKKSGVQSVILDKTDGTSVTLYDYITLQVNEAKTLALTYRGTINLSTTTSDNPVRNVANMLDGNAITNGDTLKVSNVNSATGVGYIVLGTDAQGLEIIKQVKIGDLLIAKVSTVGGETITSWEHIPSGDEQETSINNVFGAIKFVNNKDYKAFDYDSSSKTYTFTNTTYKNFVGYSTTGAAAASGLVPAPTKANLFLSSAGDWKTITINNSNHNIYIGNSGSKQKLSGVFTSNAAAAVDTYIPLATQAANTDSVWGAVKGNLLSNNPSDLGWNKAKITNGEVYYYNHTLASAPQFKTGLNIGELTIDGTKSTWYVQRATHASTNTKNQLVITYGVVGTTSTIETIDENSAYIAAPIVDGIVYYQNTWRQVKGYGHTVGKNGRLEFSFGSIADNTLTFSRDFCFADDGVNIVWAEVSEDGTTITYTH